VKPFVARLHRRAPDRREQTPLVLSLNNIADLDARRLPIESK